MKALLLFLVSFSSYAFEYTYSHNMEFAVGFLNKEGNGVNAPVYEGPKEFKNIGCEIFRVTQDNTPPSEPIVVRRKFACGLKTGEMVCKAEKIGDNFCEAELVSKDGRVFTISMVIHKYYDDRTWKHIGDKKEEEYSKIPY